MAIPALGGVAAADETRTIVDFDSDGPENLAIDDDGDVYMTMDLSGDVRRLNVEDARETDLDLGNTDRITTFETGAGFVTGIVEDAGDLYVALPSFAPATHGVWKVTQGHVVTKNLLTSLPTNGLPNGILHDRERARLLVTDSFLGRVWSIDLPGGTVDVWVDDGLLDPDTFIGANGIAMDAHTDVFVANLDHGRIVRVPMNDDGSAGVPETVIEDSRLVGADGITFLDGRTLYVAVNGQDTVVRITPSGRIHTVVDGRNGLDFPADIAFGTAGHTEGKLFVANFAFNPATGRIDGDPSLMLTHP